MQSARFLDGVEMSPTLGLDARAKEMQRQGINVVSFTLGEPDFDTPGDVKHAAIVAIDQGFTRYTMSNGIIELREAVCRKLKRENGLHYQPEEVLVSAGAKHSIYNALTALCNNEDEVLIPSPYWPSYTEIVKIARGKPILVETSAGDNFKLTGEKLADSITPATKGIILNSPSNPTGAVYLRSELAALAECICRHNLWVISDEVYEYFTYDGNEHVSIASLGNAIKSRCVTVNGLSKSFAMTGWRIGYAVAPEPIMNAMGKLQSHVTGNPNSIAQKASVAALTGSRESVLCMLEEYTKRRNYVTERLNLIPGFSCPLPAGAFYVFPNISGLLGRKYDDEVIIDDNDLARLLLTEAHVAVVPGSAFGCSKHLRFSYASSMSNLEEGLNRIEQFVRSGLS